MRLWLDDVLDAPPGWHRVQSADEAIAYLKTGGVDALSLDYDLSRGPKGEKAGTGEDVTHYLLEAAKYGRRSEVPRRIEIHSKDEEGAKAMRRDVDALRLLTPSEPEAFPSGVAVIARDPAAKASYPRDGLALSPPWLAQAVIEGRKTVIVEQENLGISDKPVLLISQGQALGIVQLGRMQELTKEEFERLSPQHLINARMAQERGWADGPFYSWPVAVAYRFSLARETNVPSGAPPVVHDVLLKYSPDQPRDEAGRFGEGTSLPVPTPRLPRSRQAQIKKLRQAMKGHGGLVPEQVLRGVLSKQDHRALERFRNHYVSEYKDEARLGGAVLAGTATAKEEQAFADAYFGGDRELADRVVTAQYAATQELLEREGAPDEMVLYRGITGDQAAALHRYAVGTRLEEDDRISLPVGSIASFAKDKVTAELFATDPEGGPGAVLKVRVPRSSVFAMDLGMGLGYELSDDEVVLLSPQGTLPATVHAWKRDTDDADVPLTVTSDFEVWLHTRARPARKYSPDQPRDEHGRFGSGGAASGSSAPSKNPRAARAVASFKPSTKEKQDAGDQSQREVAKALRGQETPDNDPMDVVISSGGRVVGVEVKTFCDQTNDKITVHPESRERKERWARRTRARVFTVVVDRRDTFAGGAHRDAYSGHRYHVAEGTGSFRLGGGALHAFDTLAGVREFMEGSK